MRLRSALSALVTAVTAAAALGVATSGVQAAPRARGPAEDAGHAGHAGHAPTYRGEIIYFATPRPGHIYPRVYAVSPAGTGKHLLYTLNADSYAFSAARDTGELLYLKSTGNGDPATLVERQPDGKIAHTIRFYPKGRFSLTTGGPGNIALSANGTTAALISYSPNDNDPSLFVIQTATGKILAEPIKATRAGKREISAVSWGPGSGELTVLDENPHTGRFEIQVLKLNGAVVRTYPVPGNENGIYYVAAGPSQILYTGPTARYKTNDRLWQQPLAGSQPKEIKTGLRPGASPVIDEPWAPGYAGLAFGTGVPDAPGPIFVTPAKGGSRYRLPHVDGYNPMWVSSLSSGR